jgi:hypothetical protein
MLSLKPDFTPLSIAATLSKQLLTWHRFHWQVVAYIVFITKTDGIKIRPFLSSKFMYNYQILSYST